MDDVEIDNLFLSNITTAHKRSLASSLLKCMSFRDNPDTLIRQIEDKVQIVIDRQKLPSLAYSIIEECLGHNSIMDNLIDGLKYLEGKSLQFDKFNQTWHEIKNEIFLILQNQQTMIVQIETASNDIQPNPSPYTSLIYTIRTVMYGEKNIDLKFWKGGVYLKELLIPLAGIENMFYNSNLSHPPKSFGNLFKQGQKLHELTVSNIGEDWEAVLVEKDGRIHFIVDITTSRLPWEMLSHPKSGFVERYLSRPLIRKIKESGSNQAILHLDKPVIGFLNTDNSFNYYEAIRDSVPSFLSDSEDVLYAFDGRMGWDELLRQLQIIKPTILHVVANGIGSNGFLASNEVLTEQSLGEFVKFCANLPSVKILMLCSDRMGNLIFEHQYIIERLSYQSQLSSVVVIPSYPGESSAYLFTKMIYKSFWRGHDLDKAMTIARSRLRLMDFESPHPGGLPMAYETESLVNPMGQWLNELKSHLNLSPIPLEYAEELIGAGYEIQISLYEFYESQSQIEPARAQLIYISESLKQSLKRFSRTIEMLDQNYDSESEHWIDVILDKTSYAIPEIENLVEEMRNKNAKFPRSSIKNAIQEWKEVINLLDTYSG